MLILLYLLELLDMFKSTFKISVHRLQYIGFTLFVSVHESLYFGPKYRQGFDFYVILLNVCGKYLDDFKEI